MRTQADSTLRQHVLFSLGTGALLPATAALPPPDDPAAATPVRRADGRHGPRGAQVTIPRGDLAFERNLGQFPSGADYVARGPGYDLLLGATGTRLGLRREDAPGASHVPAWLVVRIVGGDERAAARPHFELPSRSHYYLGAEPSAWIRDVPHFRRVEYRDVYRGIDLVYYGRDGELEYDFVVRPGANPEEIRLRIEGADRAEVTETGDLRIHTRDGSLTHRRPVAFQTIGGESRPVEARFELHEEGGATLARIAVGPHDASHDLVVDPVLAYATYLGASGAEFHATAVTDPAGNVYVGGTYSSTGLLDQSTIAYVTKLSPVADPAVEYTVYLGGSGADSIYAMAVGASGDLHVAGATTSPDLPTCLAFTDCAPYGGLQDAFVAKFSPAGDLLYSRYLGGSGNDSAASIAADAYGNFYVAGSTFSSDFPLSAAYQPFFGGGAGDMFVSKFNAAGALAYSTYLGSSGADAAMAIAVGASGDDAYVAGYTQSLSVDLPVPGALQPSFGGGTWDGYVAHFGPTGDLMTATRLGGSGDEFLEAVAVGPTGVVVAGRTSSLDFPIASPAQASLAGVQDATVSRLSPDLGALGFSTYLGGSGSDGAYAVLVDGAGDIWVAGGAGGGFPQVAPFAPLPAAPGASDAFVARLSDAGAILNAGAIGGSGTDVALSLAADVAGGVVVAGYTTSTDFFTHNAPQAARSGTYDAFLLRLEPDDAVPNSFSFVDQSGLPLNAPVISNAILPTGINVPTPISITGGTYTINGRAPTSAPGSILPGESVAVLHLSASVAGGSTHTTLTIGGVSDTFTSVTATAPSSIAATAGGGQSAPVGQAFGTPLRVIARDANGTPMPGVTVTFTAPATGASASLGASTVTTDSLGEAAVSATANGVFGTYQVGASAPGPGNSVSFTLTNLGAAVQHNVPSIAFGPAAVGSTTGTAAITITNAGNANLVVTSMTVTDPAFSVAGNCVATIPPGGTCQFYVSFKPTAEGLRTGQIQIASNAASSPPAIQLSGTGVDLSNAHADADGDGIPNGVEVAEGRNPLVKDNDIFSPGAGSARLFAMQQYRDFLNREGDPAGIQGWTDLVAAGTHSRPQVIDAFLQSQEFAGFVAPVVRLYFATFLRVPDYAGLTYNAGLVRAGTVTPVQLADFFASSPEFLATYGALTHTQFVTLLYANVLGRAPDAAGLAGWVALLEGGMSRGQVLYGFSESSEYQAAMANEVFVTMMYAGMLRRTPEPAGFSGWVGFLDAGTYTREQVINGFFLSGEYRARFLP